MRKSYLYLILFFFSLSVSIAQVRVIGLSEDQSRSEKSASHSNFRTASTVFSDTLILPFFDDFASPDVRLDSVKLFNGSKIIIYSHYLSGLPDTTKVTISGVKNSSNALIKKLNRTWYIAKIDSFQYSLDSSRTLTTPFIINKDSVIKSAYFRTTGQNKLISSPRWINNGGTYVNNRFSKAPPTYNVATFDGLASNGLPYNMTNVHANGINDNLTSLPIRLNGYTAADSIYLSFYWQTCGFGEVPDPGDSIYVEFLDVTGNWNYVWGMQGNGTTPTDVFQMAFIRVSDTSYFHKGFRFRFQSFGRQSGIFDVWNIDYVYLNKGRNASDIYTFDWAIGDASTSFLKNFSSMPYGQFFSDSSNQISTLSYKANNLNYGLSGGIYNVICKLTDNYIPGLICGDSSSVLLNSIPTTTVTFRPKIVGYANNGQPRMITQNYSVDQIDKDSTYFGENNKFTTNTILWDYFAYDDGSPEASVATNAYGSKFANQYSVIQSDTLTDIDIYFTRTTGPNMTGRTVLLSIWDENFLLKQSQQPISVGAPNAFTRYHLNTPIVITAGKNFYIGYQQNFTDLLTVGFDRNNDRSANVYINDQGGNTWDAYNTRSGYLSGALMIRAVFSKGQYLLSTKQEQKSTEFICDLYPNPTEGKINVVGEINKIVVYDLLGKEMLQKDFNILDSEKSIDLSGSSEGIYLVYLFNGTSSMVKKIILR